MSCMGQIKRRWPPVRCFIVERQDHQICPPGRNGSDYSDWQLVATALNNEIRLEDQPTGLQLEFRVKAVNTAGESMPSNSVAVVL